MKVLLIAPGFSIGERYGYRTRSRRGHFPPLGLCYIAAVLEQAGHTVRIVDMSVHGYSADDVAGIARAFAPDVVGFSLLSPSAARALALARHLKGIVKVPFVFGGPHASSFPEDCLQTGDPRDAAVVGEGEHTMLEVVQRLEAGKSLDGVAGVYYRRNGQVVQNPSRPYIADLDALPFPARHLLDNHLYSPLPNNYRRLPATNLVTSRGCPYHCTFCFQGGRGGPDFRRRSPEMVIAELEGLVHNYGIREVVFWDDNFALGRKWVLRFCDLLRAQRLDLSWSCLTRVDSVTPEVLEAMAGAGCWNIFYGLETASQELLDRIQKGTTVEQGRRAVEWTKRVGIEVRASFMLALPGETPEMGEETIRLALELEPDYAQFTLTAPMPGTGLYEDCLATGRVITDWSRHNLWQVTYIPEGYRDEAQILRLLRSAHRRFYLRPRYIWGRLKKIRTPGDLKRHIMGLGVVRGMSR